MYSCLQRGKKNCHNFTHRRFLEGDIIFTYSTKQAALNTFPDISLTTLNLHSNRLLSLNRLPPHSIDIKLRFAVEDCLHLFDTPALGLLEEEEDKCGHYNIQNRIEQEDVRAHLCNHVGRDERVHEVEEPLRAHAD